jgi:hypothetical protein
MGLLKALVGFFVNKEINTGKSKKFFDALKNDKEYQKALKELKEAPARIEASAARYRESKANAEAEYKEAVKKYGKVKADEMLANAKNRYKTESGW